MPNLFRHPITYVKICLSNTDIYTLWQTNIVQLFILELQAILDQGVWQHINNEGSKFVSRYKLFDLVYYEHFHDITHAIDREKQLKNWHHDWKVNLIQSKNLEMKDLKEQVFG